MRGREIDLTKKVCVHVAAAVVALLLAGCAGPAKMILTEEEDWPAAQRQANVNAAVAFDEEYSSFALSNHLSRASATPAVKRYRKVIVQMLNGEDEQPILGLTGIAAAVALVPDGMPLMKKGDLVEIRHYRMFGSLKSFESSGDGNAVLRLLCPSSPSRGDMAAFKACASNAKWQTRWGESNRYFTGILASPSGRPYAAHLRDHKELSFTPYYDEDGEPLAGAVQMRTRPDINRWTYPRLN